MERGCMNGGENIYLRCRKEAAKYNERLKSREGASELLGISVSSLANYELGIANFKKTPETMEHIEYDVETPSGSTQVLIGLEKLTWGSERFTCMNDQDYTLSPEERLAALKLAYAERSKVKNSGTIKTMDGWHESGFGDFSDYFAAGDEVDEGVVDHFLDILPPRSWSGSYLQVGEPYSHELDASGHLRATYTAFQRYDGRWHYIGECFAGSHNSRVTPKTRLERAIASAREEVDRLKKYRQSRSNPLTTPIK